MLEKQLRLLLVALVVVLVGVRAGADEPKKDKVSDLMHKKLEHSQKILEGIALGDFGKVTKNGDSLLLLSKELEWKVLQTQEYEVYSNEFRRTVEEMMDKAKEKNLDGVTLAYVNLTMTCVRCHKHVREVRKV